MDRGHVSSGGQPVLVHLAPLWVTQPSRYLAFIDDTREPLELAAAARAAFLARSGLEPAVHEGLERYLEFCRWPVRRMEYSFVWHALAALSRISVGPQRPLLDVGTGPSLLPEVLRGLGIARTYTLDSDLPILAARPRVSQALSGADTHSELPVCADGQRLPFRSSSFWAAVSVSVLEHLPREAGIRVLRELVRVVRDDGAVIVTVDYRELPRRDRGRQLLRRLRKAARWTLAGRVSHTLAAVQAPRPYSWDDVADAVTALTGQEVTNAWHTPYRVMGDFWMRHRQPGFSYERPRDYVSVGLVLAKNATVARRFADELTPVVAELADAVEGTRRRARGPRGHVGESGGGLVLPGRETAP